MRHLDPVSADLDVGYPLVLISAAYASTFLITVEAADCALEVLARAVIPLYDTIVIAAKIAITTITIRSSTMVKPLCDDALELLVKCMSGRALPILVITTYLSTVL